MSPEKSLFHKTHRISTKTKNEVKPTRSHTITTRPKKPELSVVNVIEQISQMLRKEIHCMERKKASGE